VISIQTIDTKPNAMTLPQPIRPDELLSVADDIVQQDLDPRGPNKKSDETIPSISIELPPDHEAVPPAQE
jgi:hypothetical protein